MTTEHIGPEHIVEPKTASAKMKIGVSAESSAIAVLAAAAAVVLSILALAGLAVVPFASIAVIATGAALLFEAAGVATYVADANGLEADTEGAIAKESIGADAIAGIGAIVLGVLSLIGVEPTVLLPAAAIILGAGLLLSAPGPMAEEGECAVPRHRELVRASFAAASGVHVLVGDSAVILGIVGVLGKAPVVMTVIAMLSIGAAQLLTGAAVGGRLASLRHAA
jgi:hypothetical protein